MDRTRIAAHADHAVLFYDTDAQRVESVAAFLLAGLHADQHVMVIATSQLRESLLSALPRDIRIRAERKGLLDLVDADDTLSMFMRDGQPDRVRFDAHVASMVRHRAADGSKLHLYSEMVAMLWSDGNVLGALLLEELWNDLQRHTAVSVMCAYPLEEANAGPRASFARLCGHHTVVQFNQRANGLAENADPRTLQVQLDAIRALLRVDNVEQAAEIIARTVADLGGTTVPAECAADGAIAIDVSLGTGKPTVPVAPKSSPTHRDLERLLPGLIEDANAAVSRAASFGPSRPGSRPIHSKACSIAGTFEAC